MRDFIIEEMEPSRKTSLTIVNSLRTPRKVLFCPNQ